MTYQTAIIYIDWTSGRCPGRTTVFEPTGICTLCATCVCSNGGGQRSLSTIVTWCNMCNYIDRYLDETTAWKITVLVPELDGAIWIENTKAVISDGIPVLSSVFKLYTYIFELVWHMLFRKWIEYLESKMTGEQKAALKSDNPDVKMVNSYHDSSGQRRVSETQLKRYICI